MARGGFGTVLKVAKAIDRANKKSARESSRRLKQQQREAAKRERLRNNLFRERAREEAKKIKAAEKEKKRLFQLALEQAKAAFENRCKERTRLRNQYIASELK